MEGATLGGEVAKRDVGMETSKMQEEVSPTPCRAVFPSQALGKAAGHAAGWGRRQEISTLGEGEGTGWQVVFT